MDQLVVVEDHFGKVGADFFKIGVDFFIKDLRKLGSAEAVHGEFVGSSSDQLEIAGRENFAFLLLDLVNGEFFVCDFFMDDLKFHWIDFFVLASDEHTGDSYEVKVCDFVSSDELIDL